MSHLSILARVAIALALAALAGCAAAPSHEDADWAATPPPEPPPATQADGAIYHDMQNMELFADARAHRIGDILTINLVESTQASKKSETSTGKTDKSTISAPTLLGQSLSIGGKTADTSTNAARSFDGNGSSTQSNQLSGALTVTVAQRLSNGNLLVRGEKWLTINQGQELVRISGIVRAQDIEQDNSVSSTRVADARIAYTGRGTLADANTQGWLSRFFNSKWMPY
ncbi:flagellar basal body L-ring protein FlgH [Rhodanobacter sp. MP1X3]|uniref:flagellar basal body L-ring protein FlgH n=1 Tax=Rhodanobacter sp. MP1X3 TaxID=2723086 RepID=UPI001613A04A|nr:flagellar basal body L-ring protein FlgH [Rhodanobacter sp. MP1X3]MBB6240871.1 flagellar L-ring protein precursor FlgH [Rhodanobacter sp. MP1X3]